MLQVHDNKTKFSRSLYWEELGNVAELLLKSELIAHVEQHASCFGIQLAIYHFIECSVEPIVTVGACVGSSRQLNYPSDGNIQFSLYLFGDLDDTDADALMKSLAPNVRQLLSLHPQLVAAHTFEQLPVICYRAAEINNRWILIQANAALGEFLGIDVATLIGKNAQQVLCDSVHPEDFDKLQTAYDFTRTTSREMTLQYRLRHHSGEYLPITERVEYSESSGITQCISVVWHRKLDQADSENQIKLLQNIESFSQDISLETGRVFLQHFCRRIKASDAIQSIALVANTRGNWWETWYVGHQQSVGPNFHINLLSSRLCFDPCWNRQDLISEDIVSHQLLFADSPFQSVVPLSFDGEIVTAALLLGSQESLNNSDDIAQMVRIFGVRTVREISQLRIGAALREQNDRLEDQKRHLTNMVTLLGQLDTAVDERAFLTTMESHLREAFSLQSIDWVYWASGEWKQIESLPKTANAVWYTDHNLVTKDTWLRYLEQCRRTGELTIHQAKMRVFWPIGLSDAGYLVVVLAFKAGMPDKDFLAFTQNALALAQQGLIQRQNLRYQAMRDSLTGLGNRMQLHSWIKTSLPKQQQASLLLFDLNRFKEINDSFGHQFGDKLLREIGPRISGYLSDKPHYLSRLGGDEFALFFPDTTPQQANELASQLHAELAESYVIEGLRFQVEASIGVSHFPRHGDDGHELLRCADVAMYVAKNRKRPVVEFHSELDNTTPLRIAVLSELESALQEGQLWVAYQPLMSTKTGQTAGFEALVRWTHPEFGPLSPGEFIPIAEMGEGIRKITDFVLHRTMVYLQTWRTIFPDLHVAVNISPRVLLDHQFPITIARMLQDYQLPGESIVMELTESTLLVDPLRAVEIINQLGDMGIKVEIDDFGTGYSSLTYLKKLPISALKIDRSFVTDILQDPHNEVIVQSTVQMAHSLGLLTVAEGVEDEATLLKMMPLGCDMIQGYYYAKPIHGKDVAKWLERNL